MRILQEATGLQEESARELLERADGELKVALVATLADVAVESARSLLGRHDGSVREALAAAYRADSAAGDAD